MLFFEFCILCSVKIILWIDRWYENKHFGIFLVSFLFRWWRVEGWLVWMNEGNGWMDWFTTKRKKIEKNGQKKKKFFFFLFSSSFTHPTCLYLFVTSIPNCLFFICWTSLFVDKNWYETDIENRALHLLGLERLLIEQKHLDENRNKTTLLDSYELEMFEIK